MKRFLDFLFCLAIGCWPVAALVLACTIAAIGGCAMNGDGLIPAKQKVSGCVVFHEPGKPPREECVK